MKSRADVMFHTIALNNREQDIGSDSDRIGGEDGIEN